MNIKKFLKYEREFYVTGDPIDTELGKMRFLSYTEYLKNIQSILIINMNVLHIYHHYRKVFEKSDEETLELVEKLKEESLFNIVRSREDILREYIRIYTLVLNEESAYEIVGDEELFDFYRALFMDMNLQKESEVSPNPEIQKGIDRSRKIKSEASKTSSTDIITSIVAGTSIPFKDVCEMTVFQVNALFQRYGVMKRYDAEVLFSTVSSEVEITSWSQNIDLFENESTSAIRRSDFDRKTKDTLG